MMVDQPAHRPSTSSPPMHAHPSPHPFALTVQQEKGHPDLVKFNIATEQEVWGFEGPIITVDRLVHILATIAWTASCHHAAVNFSQ